jgi:hypothetical protein
MNHSPACARLRESRALRERSGSIRYAKTIGYVTLRELPPRPLPRPTLPTREGEMNSANSIRVSEGAKKVTRFTDQDVTCDTEKHPDGACASSLPRRD